MRYLLDEAQCAEMTACQILGFLLDNATPDCVEALVDVSRDFYDQCEDYYEQMEVVEKEFVKKYESLVVEVTDSRGAPSFAGTWTDEGFPTWAAIESVAFSCWLGNGHAAYNCVLKHDKETPYLLILGACITQSS